MLANRSASFQSHSNHANTVIPNPADRAIPHTSSSFGTRAADWMFRSDHGCGHTVHRGSFSLHQRSTPGWASTDASPITNTFRNENTYAVVLNIINYGGSCPRQQLRHVCMFLLIEFVLRSVNRDRCTGEIPCEYGGSTSESKKGQPRRRQSTRTEEN